MANNVAELIEKLDEESKFELLELLAEELGFEIAEAVDPQSDIIDVVDNAIAGLKKELTTLQAQFRAGAELDYEELNHVAENMELIAAELTAAHASLNTLIDSEFDVEDEEGA